MQNNPDNEHQGNTGEQAPQQPRKLLKRVSNYVLGKDLGQGTFGEVKLGHHITTGEQVAIKILDKQKIRKPEDFDRIVKEIQVLKRLTSPYVVRLLEVIDTQRNIYLVTEYVNNGELFGHVQKKRKLHEDEACNFFRQIIIGVHYCHQRRVCHRDLKLENILLDQQGNVKIIDFGLSNILSTDYSLKTACGSPTYVSPEMLTQKKYFGPMVDVWACGVMLFTMIAGYLPFEDKDMKKLYVKIINGAYKFPSTISPKAKDLIERMLQVDPTKRIDLVSIMNHPWFIETSSKPIPPVSDLHISKVIDFKIIYFMMNILKINDVSKIFKSISQNKHNQLSATYYLLSEKKKNSTPNAGWDYEEQARYARELGFQLNKDGTCVVLNDNDNNNESDKKNDDDQQTSETDNNRRQSDIDGGAI